MESISPSPRTIVQLVRIQGCRFAEALTKEELSTICFIYEIPEGEQERRNSAIEIFRYMEERGLINYSCPQELVKLMRLVHREKWARETEGLIIDSDQKSSKAAMRVSDKVELRHGGKGCGKRANRKAIRSFSDLMLVKEDTDIDGPLQRVRSYSCETQSVSRMMKVLSSPKTTEDLAEAVRSTLIFRLLEDTDKEYGESNTEKASTGSDHEPRKVSLRSYRSSHSSGIESLPSDTHLDALVSGDNTPKLLETLSSADTHLEAMVSNSHTPTPLESMSLDSLHLSALQDCRSIPDKIKGHCTNVSSAVPDHQQLQNIVHLPPPRGCEVLIGSMELDTEQIKNDVQTQSQTVYKSYAFPYSSCGLQFQLHFYSNSVPSSCLLNVVMLHPSMPYPSNIHVRACIHEYDDLSDGVPLSCPVQSQALLVEHINMETTPTQTGHTQIAQFPNLLTHKELNKLQTKSLVVKVFLEYKIEL